MMLLQPGAPFAGRYEILRVLSTGGMGVVYEVLHRDTQRRRALKLMLPSLLADDDMRARFAREATVTATIESEHLVEVFDAGVDEGTGCPFLVMELLRGEDLGARLTRGERTSPRDVVSIFEQLTRALVRTHEAGIVHRDLKPENVFVTKRDDGSLRMKILDFGIAKLVDRGAKSTRSVGTPIYMAPEQMTGKGVGAAADLYALGQIAFTLLVGQPYFAREAEAAENVMSLMYAVGVGTVDPASIRGRALGVELPAAFDAWFARATHRAPASRFASATQQLDALHGVLDSAPDVLPLSSGAVRRQAAFSETEAMTSPDGDAASAEPPAARAPIDPSAAPARTHLSAPRVPSAASVERAGTTGVPSSRTLGGDAESRPRSRVALAAAALGVVTAAAVGVGVAVRSPGTTTAPTSGSALGEASGTPPIEASSQPQVTPSTAARSDVPIPDAAPTALASAPAASASAAPGRPAPGPGRAPPKSSAPSPPAPPPPPPASTPPSPLGPPTGTVWGGPRR